MAQAINCMRQSPKSLWSMNIILWATQCSGPRYGHPRQQSCSRCLGAITLEEMAAAGASAPRAPVQSPPLLSTEHEVNTPHRLLSPKTGLSPARRC
jgi:hypothetical protein